MIRKHSPLDHHKMEVKSLFEIRTGFGFTPIVAYALLTKGHEFML